MRNVDSLPFRISHSILHSTLHTFYSTLHTFYFTLHTFYFTLHISHSILHSTLLTSHLALCLSWPLAAVDSLPFCISHPFQLVLPPFGRVGVGHWEGRGRFFLLSLPWIIFTSTIKKVALFRKRKDLGANKRFLSKFIKCWLSMFCVFYSIFPSLFYP